MTEAMEMPTPTLPRTGACACGAVRWKALIAATAGACHCGMCRRWSGGVFLSVNSAALSWTAGHDRIAVWTSSPWAERGHCRDCGSALFYRVTAEGPMRGETHLAAGTLDDAEGLTLGIEVHADAQPAYYRFAQETTRMTEAEVLTFFGIEPDATPAA